jgi:hypothetical protein
MRADPELVLAGLVVAHLMADFTLQTDRIAADKNGHGTRALRGLLAHGVGVTVALAPVALAFGAPGVGGVAVIVVTHLLIDRVKVILTRRAEASALVVAHRRHEPTGDSVLGSVLGMNAAWTPVPAALFALDQAVHAGVLVLVWASWLANAPLTDGWVDAVGRFTASWAPADVHRAALLVAVGLALIVVNVRVGSLFVATLVNPRGAIPHAGRSAEPVREAAVDQGRTGSPGSVPLRGGWRLHVGPIEVRAEPEAPGSVDDPHRAVHPTASIAGVAPPARIGEAIGALERLLIVVLVLSGAEAAIGFVIAAKTLARFRQLDDRAFAEYYLLGTLASVSVALISALLANTALS